jgi:hypothetical protein
MFSFAARGDCPLPLSVSAPFCGPFAAGFVLRGVA